MTKNKYYFLQGKEMVECSLVTWAEKFDSPERTIAFHKCETWTISTVFLGRDFNVSGGKPYFFQTLIYAPDTEYNQKEFYYSSYDEAFSYHQALLALLRAEK